VAQRSLRRGPVGGPAALQLPGVQGQVGAEPVQGLLPQACSLLVADLAGVLALAAAGQAEDAAKLDDKERTRLRQQALDWLRADLALRTKQLETGNPADRAAGQSALRHWQKDSDLTGLRDRAALAKLPAEERGAYERLWADVAELLKSARPNPK